ncbi:hypothetical protein ACP70R_009603 [Stipagrostis hirtigluma subsp. patula]
MRAAPEACTPRPEPPLSHTGSIGPFVPQCARVRRHSLAPPARSGGGGPLDARSGGSPTRGANCGAASCTRCQRRRCRTLPWTEARFEGEVAVRGGRERLAPRGEARRGGARETAAATAGMAIVLVLATANHVPYGTRVSHAGRIGRHLEGRTLLRRRRHGINGGDALLQASEQEDDGDDEDIEGRVYELLWAGVIYHRLDCEEKGTLPHSLLPKVLYTSAAGNSLLRNGILKAIWPHGRHS